MVQKGFGFYRAVHIFVFLAAGFIFYQEYIVHGVRFHSPALAGITMGTAWLVYFMKAVRLYVTLYGADISLLGHMGQYCKTAPISVLLPFKSGDIFRAYCYGYELGNYIKGMTVILLDRFVDSLALASMIFLVNIIGGSGLPAIFYFLAGFLCFVITCYLLFPPVYRYWKKYFLHRLASAKRNACLRFLCRLNAAYQGVSESVKGRFAILYIISFGAWAVEIGRLVVFNQVFSYEKTASAVAEYLMSALYKTEMVYLKQFTFISIIMTAVLSFALWCRRTAAERGWWKR